MSLIDKLILQVEADTKKARAEIDKLGNSLSKTDGDTGKAKSGLAGLVGKYGEAAKAAAPYAAAVLVGGKIAFDAAAKFVNLAKASLDFASATGLSTEEASRWIAVGDDYRLTAGDMETAVGKLTKTLGTAPAKFEALGVATEDAKGNTRSANDIFIDTLAALGNITNETDRATAGNQIFGKSYKTLAPLIGSTAEEYRGMLKSVSDGQVITDKEAAKAEKLRLAQDRLSDALGDLQLALGEVVAGLGPAIDGLAQLLELTTKLEKVDPLRWLSGGDLSLFSGLWDSITIPFDKGVEHLKKGFGLDIKGKLGDDFDHIGEAAKESSSFVDRLATSITDLGTAQTETDVITKGLSSSAKELTKNLEAAKKATEDAFQANKDYADNQQTLAASGDDFIQFLADLPGKMKDVAKEAKKGGDFQRASNDLYRQGVDKAKAWADAYVESQRAAQGAAYDGKKAQADYTSALLYTASITKGPVRDSILGYIGDVNKVPADKRTEFKAVLDTYGAQAAKLYLDNLAAARDAEIAPYVNQVKAGLVSVGLAALTIQRKAEINAHANTTPAEIALAWLIRDRTANVYLNWIPGFAFGGTIPAGTTGLVAEAGFAEQVNGRTVSRPTLVRGPASVTSPLTSGPRAGGRVTIINNFPAGTRPDDVARAVRRYDRRNGTTGTVG